MMLERQYSEQVQNRLKNYPVVALIGPRQCGKTTLAKTFHTGKQENYFDLEDPRALLRLENPMLALEDLRGLVILDEIQRRPDLFPVLRVLADQDVDRKFLILGSAAPGLLQQSSESLAGRIAYIRMRGFSLPETGAGSKALEQLWLRGGFPRSYLAPSDAESFQWRQNFAHTFILKDVPSFGHKISPILLEKVWLMLAHFHGQTINYSSIANSLDVSQQLIKRYVEILEGYYLVRQLRPWHTNLKKRQIKAPKLYFNDSGLLHTALGIETYGALLTHRSLGASWEGFALAECIDALHFANHYFWSLHSGAEIDLVVQRKQPIGIEFKRTDAPKRPKTAVKYTKDIGLSHLYVVYPKGPTYKLDQDCTAISLPDFLQHAKTL